MLMARTKAILNDLRRLLNPAAEKEPENRGSEPPSQKHRRLKYLALIVGGLAAIAKTVYEIVKG